MKRRTQIATMMLLVVAVVAFSLAPAQDKPGAQRRPAPGAQAMAKVRVMMQALEIQEHFAKMLDRPLLAGQLAITRIKDLAVSGKKYEAGAELLLAAVEETPQPALRRSALLAASELCEKAGKVERAMEIAAMVLQVETEPEEEEEEREVLAEWHRQAVRGLRVHPELGVRAFRGLLPPGPLHGGVPARGSARGRGRGQPRPPQRGGRPFMQPRLRIHREEAKPTPPERHERREPRRPGREREAERRERGMGEMKEALHNRARELDQLAERLKHMQRQLQERAEQLERRQERLEAHLRELKRDRGRREGREPHEREKNGDERREPRERDRDDHD